MKILLSSFACSPNKGSEPGYGWNWAWELSNQGHEVHCFTRSTEKNNLKLKKIPENLHFHFIKLPFQLEKLYSISYQGMYLYYFLWQWNCYAKARKYHAIIDFDIVHHVTWGNIQIGSFLYKLGVPFIFGPTGGGQSAPIIFKPYFLNDWKKELIREQISKYLQKFNPGFKSMLKEAKVILTSNSDTYDLVKKYPHNNVAFLLDSSIPLNFFPIKSKPKSIKSGKLKLLWVGRLMPRKGVLLTLDVMKALCDHPEISLTVVGDGEMREELKRRIKIHKLEEKVNWIGEVGYEEVKSFYLSHDCFLFTSLRDSCPAQLLEAMAFGLPVFTLDLHGQGETITSSTGYKAPITNLQETINELKNEIIFLSENPDKYQSMSEQAIKFAKSQLWKEKVKYVIDNYYH
ncbi:glycosyltransferase family 4 protein [Cyclobacterium roseum]|uniref:glycosyltransferase family 4 protein n=1 Tax=Cyclobacterium roseum TaxID=2666137 RepID=UPI0013912182|nr:glycosyltransferase family 4 protein [Cyclobacterium roseum]